MSTWEGSQLNVAKQRLADETTRLLHGQACLPAIHATAASLFGAGGSADLDSLPRVSISSLADGPPVTVVELLMKASMAASKSEARRLIKAGGARVNDQKVEDDAAVIAANDFDERGRLKLSSGKKNHVLVVLTNVKT